MQQCTVTCSPIRNAGIIFSQRHSDAFRAKFWPSQFINWAILNIIEPPMLFGLQPAWSASAAVPWRGASEGPWGLALGPDQKNQFEEEQPYSLWTYGPMDLHWHRVDPDICPGMILDRINHITTGFCIRSLLANKGSVLYEQLRSKLKSPASTSAQSELWRQKHPG